MISGSRPACVCRVGSDPELLVGRSDLSMSQALVPRGGTDFKAAIESFALNVNLASQVVDKLVDENLANSEELRFFFDSEDHVGLCVGELNLDDTTMLQTARLRRA